MQAAVFFFHGNKIMTTGGGGILVSENKTLVDKVRFWSTQSRESFLWYEHEEIGYNYRMSNVLAAVGRAQLQGRPQMIERRVAIRDRYTMNFAGLPGSKILQDPPWGEANAWLTTIRFDTNLFPGATEIVRDALAASNIEVRHIWKPMRRQPVLEKAPSHLTGISDNIFAESLCLTPGIAISNSEVDLLSEIVLGMLTSD